MDYKVQIFFLAIIFSSCSREPLPILGEIPSFELIDNYGNLFTEENISGKIWVADLIFTTCAGPCPVMSTEMKSVHQSLVMF